jgi:hypothetical protein
MDRPIKQRAQVRYKALLWLFDHRMLAKFGRFHTSQVHGSKRQTTFRDPLA